MKRGGGLVQVLLAPDTTGFGGTKARVTLNEARLLGGGKLPAWQPLSILKIPLLKQTCAWVHNEMQR